MNPYDQPSWDEVFEASAQYAGLSPAAKRFWQEIDPSRMKDGFVTEIIEAVMFWALEVRNLYREEPADLVELTRSLYAHLIAEHDRWDTCPVCVDWTVKADEALTTIEDDEPA